MKLITSFIAGIIFAIGLTISGMVNPNVVIGFLDIFGNWNPALLFVMAGGVAVNFITFNFILKKGQGYGGCELDLPTKKEIDKKLILGSVIFGIGWGMYGLCPAPTISNLFLLNGKIIIFFLSMISGMLIFQLTSGS
jgi:uncharacterized membrane protein YedE/YeeE